MNPSQLKYASLIAAVCFHPALTQMVVGETTVATSPAREIATEAGIPGDTRPVHDPAFVKRHLSVLPRDVVETTETRDDGAAPGPPRRHYNAERNVVIVEERELPFCTIPVLFEEKNAEFLDIESWVILEETAEAIHEVLKAHPDAVFEIEGHTRTGGADEANLTLSAERAQRVHQELTQRYLIPTSALSAHGYGDKYSSDPGETEEQMMNQRLLVVRAK